MGTANFEQESGDREREDAALRVLLTKLQQDLAAERDERLTGVSANKRALQSLDGTMTQQLKDMRHTLETEIVDRESGDDRSLKLNAEIRASVESERVAR